MGNIESSQDGSLSRRSSQRKSGSPSPPSEQKRSNSLKKNNQTNNSIRSDQPLIRRSKTCRVKDRSQRVRPLCMVTGLTAHQKVLLAKKWSKMDNTALYEMGKRVFEGVFAENPHFLAFIGLSQAGLWKKNIAFRLHTQRFVTSICECLRRMRDTQAACDVLRDFGALYSSHRVPNAYFEKLALALCNAAKDFEDFVIAENERHRSPSADPSSSSATDSAISNGNSSHQYFNPLIHRGSTLSTISANTTKGEVTFGPTENRFPSSIPHGYLPSRHSDSAMYKVNGLMRNGSLRGTPPHNSSDSDSPPIRPNISLPPNGSQKSINCPVANEAWSIFASFVANQIKFGYELEKVLQLEMSKLGLSTKHTNIQVNDSIFSSTKQTIDVE
ncbi:unnamed protein product, partial [Mesorhabditis belari]|uniref:Globin family profile domain-containing protein n=1 Tax=Mesorhabditis belari TaxID=2138241 RepID=A0AAF3ELB7_9BILA